MFAETRNNQLKFNLNAVVDKLNLVNLVHQPAPILIEKSSNLSKNRFHSLTNPEKNVNCKSSQNFEFIDEEKLSMYAFLVQRDLKTKECFNNYEQEKFDQQAEKDEEIRSVVQIWNKNVEKQSINNKKNKSKVTVISSLNQPPSFQLDASAVAKIPLVADGLKFPTQINKSLNHLIDLKKCCEDSIKSIENLGNQLSQYKYERLKIIYNDPQEELKQKRILTEQIKYLLRSNYNLQNQISKIRDQLSKSTTVAKSLLIKNATLPEVRLTHSMRQVIKSVHVFSDLYPYRPENDLITEKLCNRFFQQLHLYVGNFNDCLIHLSNNKSNPDIQIDFSPVSSRLIVDKLSALMANCNQFFTENNSNEREVKSQKNKADSTAAPKVQTKKLIKTKPKPKLNVTSTMSILKSNLPPTEIKNSSDNQNAHLLKLPTKSRTEIIAPLTKKNDRTLFEQRTIKTSKLYPRNLKSTSTTSINRNHRINDSFAQVLSSTESLKSNHSKPTSSRNPSSMSEQLYEATMSTNSLYSPAFNHFSSPKLSKIGYKKVHKSPYIPIRYNSDNELNFNREYKKASSLHSQSPLRLKTRDDEPYEKLSRSLIDLKNQQKEELETLKANHENIEDLKSFIRSKTNPEKEIYKRKQSKQKSVNLFARLDDMKKQSDLIRRKYEKLNYEDTLIQKNSYDTEKSRRPYEECYLGKDAVIFKEYDNKIDKIEVNSLYKSLNKPTNRQLELVLDYAKKFAEYNQKTSETVICESKFNDFELFESLSNDLYEELVDDVVKELEYVNQELTTKLINNELVIKDENDNSYSSLMIVKE